MPQGKVEIVPADGLTTRQRRRQAVLAVHTGHGKGKSTAAFGMALRAWSAGWDIGVFQFVKSPKWKVGEETALKALGEAGGASVAWHKMGEGWSWIQRAGTERDHASEAAEGWAQIKRDLAADLARNLGGMCLRLDEITSDAVTGAVRLGDPRRARRAA